MARLRPRPSQRVGSWWSAHRVTAPALAGGLPGSTGAPFPGSGSMLVGADHAGVDLGVPVQLPSPIRLGAQRGLDPAPGPIALPARKPLVDRLPGPIPLRQVSPGHPGADPEQDAVEDLAVVPPPPTPLRGHRWQQRGQPRPLRIGDLKSSVHGRLLPEGRPAAQLANRSGKHALATRPGPRRSAVSAPSPPRLTGPLRREQRSPSPGLVECWPRTC